MNFRQLQEADIQFMADNSLFSREHWKSMCGQLEFNYALEHNGNVLGIGGLKMINNHTAYGWFDMSIHAKNHVIICYRVIKEWLQISCKELGIRRLEAYVEADFEAGQRTVEHLGFTYEYTAKNFFGDKPGKIYSICFDGDKR
jgi:RimJ/RimL family protein N-acetyltransferase